MALDFIQSLLTTKGLELAEPFFTALVESDPARTTQSLLELGRRLGFSYSDTPARNLINQLKANVETKARFQLGALDELPSPGSLLQAKGPLSRNYAFVATITGYNPMTAERETRGVTVVSDSLLTPAQVISAVIDKAENAQLYSALLNSSIQVTEGRASRYAPR